MYEESHKTKEMTKKDEENDTIGRSNDKTDRENTPHRKLSKKNSTQQIYYKR